ncbi:hypothetical protein [Propionivibrio sp.]|uniref:hypothetical protein n=1 Tax=Propionivibrio sp. TaxID=2212460 RepID=UPI003BF2D8F1
MKIKAMLIAAVLSAPMLAIGADFCLKGHCLGEPASKYQSAMVPSEYSGRPAINCSGATFSTSITEDGQSLKITFGPSYKHAGKDFFEYYRVAGVSVAFKPDLSIDVANDEVSKLSKRMGLRASRYGDGSFSSQEKDNQNAILSARTDAFTLYWMDYKLYQRLQKQPGCSTTKAPGL